MIFELFWVFDTGSLLIERNVREALSILDLGAARWTRYDLDGMQNWRGYDLQRVTIDALTQRTAYVRVDGEDGAMALVAMGKRGEPPTLMVRSTSEHAQLERLLRTTLTWELPIKRAGISPVAAREAFHRRNIALAQVGGVDIATWLSVVRRETMTLPEEALSQLVTIEEARPGMLLITMIEDPTTAPEEAAEHWLSVARKLS